MCAAQAIDLTKKVKCKPSRSLDLSKENLPPQPEGKKTLLLGTPLRNETDSKYQQLNKEKQHLEWLLQSYSGDDPLKPRYDYITWIEHNYDNNFSNTKYICLLEDTISLFKDDLRYKQDTRFIEIIVKYVELQQDQVDLYQTLFSQGLGTLCSMLYLSWADALDRINDYNRANQVFETGIRYSAQPLEQLKRAQVDFQLNLGRRMLQPQIVSPRKASSTCIHQALSKFKKPTQILSNNIIQGKSIPLHNANCEGSNFAYQDNNDGNKATFCKKSEKLNISSASVKVNTLPAETVNTNGCTSSKLKIPIQSSAMPKFHVHSDTSNEVGPNVLPIISSILKPIKGIELSKICPLALFEPPDPKKKAMYPKEKVYSGGKELQLEELKARLYDKKYEEYQTRLNASQIIPGNTAGENENFTIYTNTSDNISSKSDISLQKLSQLQTSIMEHKYLVNSNENPSNLTLEKNENVSKNLSQMSVNNSVDGVTRNLMLFSGCDNRKNLSYKDNDNNPLDLSQLQSGNNVIGNSQNYDLLNKNKNQSNLSHRNVKSDSSYTSGGFQSEESSAYLNGSKLTHCQEQHFSVIEKQSINETAPEKDLIEKKEFCDVDDNVKHRLFMNTKEDTSFSLGSQFSIPKERSDYEYQQQSDDTMDTFTLSQIHKPFQVSYENMKNEQSKYFNASCNEMIDGVKTDKEISCNSSDNSTHSESIGNKIPISWKPDSSLNKSKPISIKGRSVGTTSFKEEKKVQRIWKDKSPAQAQETEDSYSRCHDKDFSDDKITDTFDLPSTSENGNDYNIKEIVSNALNLGKKEDGESLLKTLQNPTAERVDKLESKIKNDVQTTDYDKFNTTCNKWEENHSESKCNINLDSSRNKCTFENVKLSSNIFSSISHSSNSKTISNKSYVDQSGNKHYVGHENRDKLLVKESHSGSLKKRNTVVKIKHTDKCQSDTSNIKKDSVNSKLKSIITDVWNDSDSDAETEVKFKMTNQQKDSSGKFIATGQQKESLSSIYKSFKKDSNNPAMLISEDKSTSNDSDKTKSSGIFHTELKVQHEQIDGKTYSQNAIVKTSCAPEGGNKKIIGDNVSGCMKWKNVVNNIWDDSDSEGEMRVQSKISRSNVKDNFYMLRGETNKSSNHPIMSIDKASSFDYIDQPSISNQKYFKLNQETQLNEKRKEIFSNKINNEPILMKEGMISLGNNDRTKTFSVHQDCSSNIKKDGNNVKNFINDVWNDSSSENEFSYKCMASSKKQNDFPHDFKKQNIVGNCSSVDNQYSKYSDKLGEEKLKYSHILLEINEQNQHLCTQRSFIDPKEQITECEKQISSDPCRNIGNINDQLGATITNPFDIKRKYIFKGNTKLSGAEQLQDATGEDDSFSGYCGEMNESFPLRNDSFNCSMGNPLTGNYLGNNSDTKINFDVDKMINEYENHETSDIEDRRRYRFGIDDSF